GLKLKDLEKNINCSVSHTMPEDTDIVPGSINKGQPFVLTRPSSDIARSVIELASSIIPPSAPAAEEKEDVPRKSIISKIFSF
ncbi:MAG: histidine kinase, partial [Desulfocucumaceae bacterium]